MKDKSTLPAAFRPAVKGILGLIGITASIFCARRGGELVKEADSGSRFYGVSCMIVAVVNAFLGLLLIVESVSDLLKIIRNGAPDSTPCDFCCDACERSAACRNSPKD